MEFKPAIRKQVKLKIGISGPSGSGKTYSALSMAEGIGKRIAVIDTENDSASWYSDRFKFDTMKLAPPYTVPKYIEAMKLAERAGYDVVIIDSASHAWIGDGGLLSKKEKLDSRGGNSFTNWATITQEHEIFKAAILNAGIHLICTLRSKQDYAMETNDRGKAVPKKVGMAPQQRDGFEYELGTVFDLAMDHNASVSKDRSGIWDGQIFKITKETGERFIAWLNDGDPQPSPADEAAPPLVGTAFCTLCASVLVLHSSGAGYVCPGAKARNDGHTRIPIEEFRKQYQQPEQAPEPVQTEE